MAINVRLKNNAGTILHPQTSAGLVTGLTQFISGVISSGGLLNREIVETLPTENISASTIYMVLKETAATDNVYNEYLYIDGKWELIGDTAVSLVGYATEEFVTNAIKDKADKATTLEGYGITDAVSDAQLEAYKGEVTEALGGKADKATTLAGYGIEDAVSDAQLEAYKGEVTEALGGKADKATTLEGYGITDAVSDAQLEAYKGEVTEALGGKADNATTLAGYGIEDAVSDAQLEAYKGEVTNALAGINTTISGLISYEEIVTEA